MTQATRALPASTDAFESDCPTRVILDRLGDKWVALILVSLAERPHHFGELHRRIKGVSKKMLTQSLRILERYGLISRRPVPGTYPARMCYALTDLGSMLVTPLFAVYQWTQDNTDVLLANQDAYDRTHAEPAPAALTVAG